MKAAEYAEKLWKCKCAGDAIAEIGRSFLQEVGELAEARHVKTEEGLANIIRELHQKYCKFVSIVHTKYYPNDKILKYDGFLNLVKAIEPKAYNIYVESLK
jgi:DNA polymerase elongation subunit (family B)